MREVPGIVAACAPYVKEINFFYMRPVGRAVALSENYLNFDEHFRSALDTIALRTAYPGVRIMHFEQSFIERSIAQDVAVPASLASAPPYGSTTLGLHSDGSMWPHGYTPYQAVPRLKLGQYPASTLSSIWHDSPVLDGIRHWLRALMNRCESCAEHRHRCAGLNFEMEVARQMGHVDDNPYCISDKPMPAAADFIPLNREGAPLAFFRRTNAGRTER
jgi:MoaA/NifB/PqqE/SkfB family radical SAM enzyme